MTRFIQVIACVDGSFDVGDTEEAHDLDGLLNLPDLMTAIAWATSMSASRGGLPVEIICGPHKATLDNS